MNIEDLLEYFERQGRALSSTVEVMLGPEGPRWRAFDKSPTEATIYNSPVEAFAAAEEAGLKSRQIVRPVMEATPEHTLNSAINNQMGAYRTSILEDVLTSASGGGTKYEAILETFDPEKIDVDTRFGRAGARVGLPIADEGIVSIPTILETGQDGAQRTLTSSETLQFLQDEMNLTIRDTLKSGDYGKLIKRMKGLFHTRALGFWDSKAAPWKVAAFDAGKFGRGHPEYDALVDHFADLYTKQGVDNAAGRAKRAARELTDRVLDGQTFSSHKVLKQILDKEESRLKTMTQGILNLEEKMGGLPTNDRKRMELAEQIASGRRAVDSLSEMISSGRKSVQEGTGFTSSVRALGFEFIDGMDGGLAGMEQFLMNKGDMTFLPDGRLVRLAKTMFPTLEGAKPKQFGALQILASSKSFGTEVGIAEGAAMTLEPITLRSRPRLNAIQTQSHPYLYPIDEVESFFKKEMDAALEGFKRGEISPGFRRQLEMMRDQASDGLIDSMSPQKGQQVMRQRNYARKILDAADAGTLAQVSDEGTIIGTGAAIKGLGKSWIAQFKNEKKVGGGRALQPSLPIPYAARGHITTLPGTAEGAPMRGHILLNSATQKVVINSADQKYYKALGGFDDDDLVNVLLRKAKIGGKETLIAALTRDPTGPGEFALMEIGLNANDPTLAHNPLVMDALRRTEQGGSLARAYDDAAQTLMAAQDEYDDLVDLARTYIKTPGELEGRRLERAKSFGVSENAAMKQEIRKAQGVVDEASENVMKFIRDDAGIPTLDLDTVPTPLGHRRAIKNGRVISAANADSIQDMFEFIPEILGRQEGSTWGGREARWLGELLTDTDEFLDRARNQKYDDATLSKLGFDLDEINDIRAAANRNKPEIRGSLLNKLEEAKLLKKAAAQTEGAVGAESFWAVQGQAAEQQHQLGKYMNVRMATQDMIDALRNAEDNVLGGVDADDFVLRRSKNIIVASESVIDAVTQGVGSSKEAKLLDIFMGEMLQDVGENAARAAVKREQYQGFAAMYGLQLGENDETLAVLSRFEMDERFLEDRLTSEGLRSEVRKGARAFLDAENITDTTTRTRILGDVTLGRGSGLLGDYVESTQRMLSFAEEEVGELTRMTRLPEFAVADIPQRAVAREAEAIFDAGLKLTDLNEADFFELAERAAATSLDDLTAGLAAEGTFDVRTLSKWESIHDEVLGAILDDALSDRTNAKERALDNMEAIASAIRKNQNRRSALLFQHSGSSETTIADLWNYTMLRHKKKQGSLSEEAKGVQQRWSDMTVEQLEGARDRLRAQTPLIDREGLKRAADAAEGVYDEDTIRVMSDAARGIKERTTFRDMSVDALRGIWDNPLARGGVIAGAGLAAFGFLYQGLRNKDRTPEELAGPPLLPGGDYYEGGPYDQPAISEGGFNPAGFTPFEDTGMYGTSFKVTARGDVNPDMLAAQMEKVGGFPVSQTVHNAPTRLDRTSALTGYIQQAFR